MKNDHVKTDYVKIYPTQEGKIDYAKMDYVKIGYI